MRRWFGRRSTDRSGPPIFRDAEVHRFQGQLFVAASWARAFGVAVPATADAGEVGSLVADALDWSGRHPRPVFSQLGGQDPHRSDREGWERFCRTVAGVDVSRYRPEIHIMVKDRGNGLLRLYPVSGDRPIPGLEVTVSADAGRVAIGEAVEQLLAQTAPEWPSFRHVTVHATNDNRLALYGWHGGHGIGPVKVFDTDVEPATLGTAIHAALVASEDLGADGRPWGQALAAAGLAERVLGPVSVSVRQTVAGAIHLSGDHGGSPHEETILADGDPAVVAAAVLARLWQSTPATPTVTGVPFGYKTAWFAIRSTDVNAVGDALGLTARREVTWGNGVEESYRGGVFITPSTNGWILAVGVDLLSCEPDLPALSASLATEVQFFATHRVSDAHEWQLADRGRLTRSVRYADDSGRYDQRGEPTEVEERLGLVDLNDDAAMELVTEDTVMRVAGSWSIDPQCLSTTATTGGTGIHGRLPSSNPKCPHSAATTSG